MAFIKNESFRDFVNSLNIRFDQEDNFPMLVDLSNLLVHHEEALKLQE